MVEERRGSVGACERMCARRRLEAPDEVKEVGANKGVARRHLSCRIRDHGDGFGSAELIGYEVEACAAFGYARRRSVRARGLDLNAQLRREGSVAGSDGELVHLDQRRDKVVCLRVRAEARDRGCASGNEFSVVHRWTLRACSPVRAGARSELAPNEVGSLVAAREIAAGERRPAQPRSLVRVRPCSELSGSNENSPRRTPTYARRASASRLGG